MITAPDTISNPSGFIYIAIYDKYVDTVPIDTIYIPINNLKSFIPVNFVIKIIINFYNIILTLFVYKKSNLIVIQVNMKLNQNILFLYV